MEIRVIPALKPIRDQFLAMPSRASCLPDDLDTAIMHLMFVDNTRISKVISASNIEKTATTSRRVLADRPKYPDA
jgi:hypothetical protein